MILQILFTEIAKTPAKAVATLEGLTECGNLLVNIYNGSHLPFPATIRHDSRGASRMIQLNNNLK